MRKSDVAVGLRGLRAGAVVGLTAGLLAGTGFGQNAPATGAGASAAAPTAETVYKPLPGFDTSSIDAKADPCNDFYKFACGKFAANHPIPADQTEEDIFYSLFNVNTQSLRGILEKEAAGGTERTPDEQKIGDYYKSCMDTDAIEKRGLAPIQPMLAEIDGLGNGMMAKRDLPGVIGKLQREGVAVFFGYGEQQDLKDATKQIAFAGQGGLGLPEKDYYLRTGAKDEEIRKQYVAHVAKMLTLAGSTPEKAQKDADAIMRFETTLAKSSMGVVDLRDPEKTYHLQPIATFEKSMPGVNFATFEEAVHSPHVTEINDSTPEFFPALHGRGPRDRYADPQGLHAISPADRRGQPAAQGVRRGELRLLRPQAERPATAAGALEALLERRQQRPRRGARQGVRRAVLRRRQQGQDARDGARHRARDGCRHRPAWTG